MILLTFLLWLSSVPFGQSQLVTEREFIKAVSSCYSYNPPRIHYTNLMAAIRRRGGIDTKREFAMFLANILWESDGLKTKTEYACQNNGCPTQYSFIKTFKNKKYYGRGYIQLTWYNNYEAASKKLYGNLRLISRPELLENDEMVAWETAVWYWKKNVHSQVQNGEFGKSIKAINGAIECGKGGKRDLAKKRFDLYVKVLKALNINEKPNERGCYN